MAHGDASDTKFHALLSEQVRNEFTAAQQYIAIAVHFDGADLPQLAALFYRQSVDERNHAMMMVRYLLDRGIAFGIPDIDPVCSQFASARAAIATALDLERGVTEQIVALAAAARDEDAYLGEQFIGWFLKEQVEEVAAMTTLLRIADRAGVSLFDIEDFVAREMSSATADPSAPVAAGGTL